MIACCSCMTSGTISLTIPKLKQMEEGLVNPHWLVNTHTTPSFPKNRIWKTFFLNLTQNQTAYQKISSRSFVSQMHQSVVFGGKSDVMCPTGNTPPNATKENVISQLLEMIIQLWEKFQTALLNRFYQIQGDFFQVGESIKTPNFKYEI